MQPNNKIKINTFAIALLNLPVIFLQILETNCVDEGGNSLITVFRPIERKKH